MNEAFEDGKLAKCEGTLVLSNPHANEEIYMNIAYDRNCVAVQNAAQFPSPCQ
jgi:hypothetical protein